MLQAVTFFSLPPCIDYSSCCILFSASFFRLLINFVETVYMTVCLMTRTTVYIAQMFIGYIGCSVTSFHLLHIGKIMSFFSPPCSLLRVLITFVETDDVYSSWLYAFAMFISSMACVLCMQTYIHILYMTGMHLRTALTSTIYRKVSCLTTVVVLSLIFRFAFGISFFASNPNDSLIYLAFELA